MEKAILDVMPHVLQFSFVLGFLSCFVFQAGVELACRLYRFLRTGSLARQEGRS